MAGPTEVTVEISTSSQQMTWPNLPQPSFPTITLNGQPLPQPEWKPSEPSGFQVVVFDSTQDITQPASILSNQYFQLYAPNGLWADTYQYLYRGMVTAVLTSGNVEAQIVLVASYGLDVNMPPTNDALGLFLGLGAGPELQKWETSVDVGSEGGFVGNPGNYILVGETQNGYGEGTEQWDYPGTSPVETTVTATVG
jgi:hypothetical protein